MNKTLLALAFATFSFTAFANTQPVVQAQQAVTSEQNFAKGARNIPVPTTFWQP